MSFSSSTTSHKMTPTPPSTTSSSTGGRSPDEQFRVVRKRNRVPLSCAACRHRKLKCNRSNPCENCIRRGDAASCSYAAPGSRKKSQGQPSNTPDDMQNRIDRLEGLVLSLMTNGANSAGPAAAQAAISRSASESGPSSARTQDVEYENDDDMIREENEDSEVEEVSNSFGVLKVDADAGKSMYIGDSHWHLILSDIAEVKNYFNTHKRDLDAQYSKLAERHAPTSGTGVPTFLCPTVSPTSESELRATVPPKAVLERLVSRFFNSLDMAIFILHGPTFHKALQEFIRDPQSKSLVWIGLLFSILTIAMQSYSKMEDEPPEWKGRTKEMSNEYRRRTVQCLQTSDFTKSAVYTIETLVLYLHGEYSDRFDAEVGLWLIASMTIRLGMRMGYHRDPQHFPGVTPYQIEMRRRVWAFLRQIDIMFSNQLALPSMIRSGDFDVELPSNVYDDEFGPDSTALPIPRSNSEATPISYALAKSKMAFMFGEILEELNSVRGRQAPYEDVMAMDRRLRELRDGLAPHLKLRPLNDCMLDPAGIIMGRFYIDVMFHKSVCVLHRKYLARARHNPRYSYSRRTCIESALAILEHQQILYVESKPGGRLHTIKWYISSFTKGDFLLGAMIVCLDLNADASGDKYDELFWTAEQRAAMIAALERSCSIWTESLDSSMEAFKAANILRIMLEKVKQNGARQAALRPEPQTTNEAFAAFDADLKPEHSAAMTLGMLSSGALTPNTANALNFGGQGYMPTKIPNGILKYGNVDMTLDAAPTGLTPNYMMDDSNTFAALGGAASPFSSVFGNMGTSNGMDLPNNLDWDAWDSYVQNGSVLDPTLQFNYDTSMPNIPELQTDTNGQSNSVFMGANTPGKL